MPTAHNPKYTHRTRRYYVLGRRDVEQLVKDCLNPKNFTFSYASSLAKGRVATFDVVEYPDWDAGKQRQIEQIIQGEKASNSLMTILAYLCKGHHIPAGMYLIKG